MNDPKPIDAAALVSAIPRALGAQYLGRLWTKRGVNQIHVYLKQGRREVGVFIVGVRGLLFDPMNILATENRHDILARVLAEVKNPSAEANDRGAPGNATTPEGPEQKEP